MKSLSRIVSHSGLEVIGINLVDRDLLGVIIKDRQRCSRGINGRRKYRTVSVSIKIIDIVIVTRGTFFCPDGSNLIVGRTGFDDRKLCVRSRICSSKNSAVESRAPASLTMVWAHCSYQSRDSQADQNRCDHDFDQGKSLCYISGSHKITSPSQAINLACDQTGHLEDRQHNTHGNEAYQYTHHDNHDGFNHRRHGLDGGC